MTNLKVWDINLENEEDAEHIASLTTTEVPLVGARFKMFRECIFEITEVVYCTSEAHILSTDIKRKDYKGCAWGYDNNKRFADYFIVVKVVDGEYKIK